MTDASLNVLWLLTEQEVLLAKHLVSCRRIALQRTLCMTTESTTGWDVGGSLDGWMNLYMGVCMFMFGQVGRLSPATAYLLLLSTGATDLLMDLLQEPLHLLTGLLQFSLLLPQQPVLQSQHMYLFFQLSPVS